VDHQLWGRRWARPSPTCDAGIRATGPHRRRQAIATSLGLPRSLISRCSEAPMRANRRKLSVAQAGQDCQSRWPAVQAAFSALGMKAAAGRWQVGESRRSSQPPRPVLRDGFGQLSPAGHETGPRDSTRQRTMPQTTGLERPLPGAVQGPVVWPWGQKGLGGQIGRSVGYHQVGAAMSNTIGASDPPLNQPPWV